ncbi:Rap1a/Tai family immunity protein [Humitalea sp. 24SJ18S-53]|uniref:Rap1a/Tai family immunity protein n=1 Tax=Humitalea sp. 24SJ18S-53 TaxID=3422307 RepID=UPI003D668936
MKARVPAALLAFAALSSAAHAQTAPAPLPIHARTVAELAAICAPGPTIGPVMRLEAIAYCQGFLTAAGQYHAAVHRPGARRGAAQRPPVFCLPTPAPSVAQVGIGFAEWAATQPQRAGEPALEGVLRFARATYPCPTPARRAAR